MSNLHNIDHYEYNKFVVTANVECEYTQTANNLRIV